MTAMVLEGHSGTSVAIDLCTRCQAFWFDRRESLQLAPGSTLKLFTVIGERPKTGKVALAPVLRCPQCRARLLPTHDRQRSTPFQYWRCDNGHGRFITFFEFLREKNFIRPLTPAQIEELRQNIQILNCSNCGAAIDLAAKAECTHCGSPVSMLDMKQAEQLVIQLQKAAEPRPIDSALPLELARARLDVEASFASADLGQQWWRDASSSGLVEAGLSAVARWLKKS
jgi:DNA-directed RNA polymerase subunit RPC12/RpoP